MEQFDVLIIGGGAAGLSAGLYSSRAMLKTVVIEKIGFGGQILVTDEIENYPGFPKGIKGPELSTMMEEQTRRFGAELKYEEVVAVEQLNGPLKIVHTSENSYCTKTIIIASGGSHKKLGVPGEEDFSGKGVSYCAVCDANFFRGEEVIVVGGGDAALDEGSYLTGIVEKVTVIHRRDQLRASKILQERALANPKMDLLLSHVVEEFRGTDLMDRVLAKNLKTGESYEFPATGAFIYIGFIPNSDFLKGVLPTDDLGHINSDIQMRTSIPGVFVCGDVRTHSERQLGSAVGDGITAALTAYHYISGD